MSNIMPTPDTALKDFFRNNEIFAGLFNGYFFNNEQVIDAKELEPDDTAYSASIKIKGDGKHKIRVEKINKYRDKIKRTSIGYLVILGIEDQDKIHYSMPVKNMLYDALGYSTELSELSKIQDKAEWTVDEWLSKVKKGTKITPIITVVFYTGEDTWDGPKSLHDMMDIDDKIKAFVPDYPLYVIDIGHDKTLSFNNKELSELKDMLSSIYAKTADKNESLVDTSTIALTGILTGDEKLYLSAVESKGGKQKVCRALAERDEKIKAEFNAQQKEKDELLAKRDAELSSKNAELATKDAEIAELKRQLAEARK